MSKARAVAERLAANSVPEPNTGCVLWLGTANPLGYGKMRVGRRMQATHRLSYEVHVRPVPDGLLVLHSCDQPSCLRPDHLFLGTASDNMRDMVRKGRHSQQKRTLCVHGHTLDGSHKHCGGIVRCCLECGRLASRAYRAKVRAREEMVAA